MSISTTHQDDARTAGAGDDSFDTNRTAGRDGHDDPMGDPHGDIGTWLISMMMSLVLLLLAGTGAMAQNDTCHLDRLPLSTGWNRISNTVHPTGVTTPFWQVIVDPAGGTVPRPANVIAPNSGWAAPGSSPISQWIASTSTWSNQLNGNYEYETNFCLDHDFKEPRLTLKVWADDSATVYLNGYLVGTTTASPAFSVSTMMIDSNAAHFNAGANSLRVVVTNSQAIASGLRIEGFVGTSNGAVLRPECCDAKPQEDCFELSEEKVECTQIPGTNLTGYDYSFAIRSLHQCDASTAQVASVTVTSPSGVSVSPSGFSVSTSWSPHTLLISGPGAVAGATVSMLVKVCCVSADGVEERCCEEYVRVTLPDCPPVDQGCLTLVKDTIECRPTSAGPGFGWCFSVKNIAPWPAQYLFLSPGGPFTITPNFVTFSPAIPSGGVSSNYCFSITGPGAVPGSTIKVYFRICDKQRENCCLDSAYIRLPKCDDELVDCCRDFVHRFLKLSNTVTNSGSSTVGGLMFAAGPGATPIKQVKATLVSVSINSSPSWGFITGGFLSGFGAGTLPSYPMPHDITWGPSVPVVLSGNSFNLNLSVPALAGWRDTVRYAIRFSYTDAECRTCDTVLTFAKVRRRFIIIHHFPWLHGPVHGGRIEKGGTRTQSADEPGISGVLDGDEGHMHIVLPDVDPQYGSITYTGLELESAEPDVSISDATADGYHPFVHAGRTWLDLNAPAGTTIDYDLSYTGLNDRPALVNRLTLHFVLSSMPDDTLEEVAMVTLRRDGLAGGDQLTAEEPKQSDVRTFALHLENANGTDESITRLLLTAPDGVEILAVGPTDATSSALLMLGTDGSRGIAGDDLAGEEITLEPGETHGPIYVTIAGGGRDDVEMGFATVNDYGQTVTEGSVTLHSAVSGVAGGSAPFASTAILEGSAPNPTSTSATIRFHLPTSDQNVTLMITDERGNEVARPIDGESLMAGEHVVVVNTAALPSGTYYYTLRSGSSNETRSMQVVR